MKTITLIIVLLVSGLVSAQKFGSAVEFNDHIVALQNEVGQKMVVFNEQVGGANSTLESVQPYFDDLLATTRDVVKRLENVTPWDKNTELKNAALELFRFYEVTIDRDYREMVNIVYTTEMSEEDFARLNEILVKVTEGEKGYDKRFQDAQQAFADKYDFILERNELQDEFDGE
jgi:hypothetical protein